MPIYEYACNDCGRELEAWQKITATGADCEHCGSENTKRQISQTSFVLKGSGWYVTDYARKGNGASAENSSGETKSDKADSKADSASTKSDTETKKPAKTESKAATAA